MARRARVTALARRLHEEHGSRSYVLVDNDPWGYYIYSVVSRGSINLASRASGWPFQSQVHRALELGSETYGLPRNVGIISMTKT